MDCLARLGFSAEHVKVRKGLKWFRDNQRPDGTWHSSYEGRTAEADLWVSYAVCRMFKSFCWMKRSPDAGKKAENALFEHRQDIRPSSF
jgi:hypothetical protein